MPSAFRFDDVEEAKTGEREHAIQEAYRPTPAGRVPIHEAKNDRGGRKNPFASDDAESGLVEELQVLGGGTISRMSFQSGGSCQLAAEEESQSAVQVRQIGNAQEKGPILGETPLDFAKSWGLVQQIEMLQHIQAKHGIKGAVFEGEGGKAGFLHRGRFVVGIDAHDVSTLSAILFHQNTFAGTNVQNPRVGMASAT